MKALDLNKIKQKQSQKSPVLLQKDSIKKQKEQEQKDNQKVRAFNYAFYHYLKKQGLTLGEFCSLPSAIRLEALTKIEKEQPYEQ